MPWLELQFGPEPEKPRLGAGGPAGKELSPSDLLREQIRAFVGPIERYRDSKENKAYLATVAYIGGGMSLLTQSNPPWDRYSSVAFALFCLVVLGLSVIAFWFVWLQFTYRRYAGDIFGACLNVFSLSLSSHLDRGQLDPIQTRNLPDKEKWPRAIAEEFERAIAETHKGVWYPRFLTISAMGLTGLAILCQLVSAVAVRCRSGPVFWVL